MRQCWLQIAEHRPEVSVVTKFLNDASRQWELRSPTGHEGLSQSNGTSTFASKDGQEQTFVRTSCISSSHSRCRRILPTHGYECQKSRKSCRFECCARRRHTLNEYRKWHLTLYPITQIESDIRRPPWIPSIYLPR